MLIKRTAKRKNRLRMQNANNLMRYIYIYYKLNLIYSYKLLYSIKLNVVII